jgi:RNA polymerase sigma-70 factor (ECF subfamily)
MGEHHDSAVFRRDDSGRPQPFDPAEDSTVNPGRLAAWTEFHTAIQELPDDEREIVELLWYQGLTQPEASALLEIPERTLRRHWQQIRIRLHDLWKTIGPED